MAFCLLSRRTSRTKFAESLFAIHDSLLGEAAWTVGQSFFTVPTPVLLRKRGIDRQKLAGDTRRTAPFHGAVSRG